MSDRKKDVNDAIVDKLVDSDLTDKQQNFILYYLESNNASQAYLKAYHGEKKWSYIKGSELLRNPKIASAIRRFKKILMKSFDVDPSQYVEYLLKVANADISDYITFNEEEVPVLDTDGTQMFNPDTGEPLTKKINKMHLVDSDYVDCSVIEGIKQGRDGISIQLADKAKAWEKLAKFFGWAETNKGAETEDSGIIEAIAGKVDSVWDDDNLDEDLDNTLKQQD